MKRIEGQYEERAQLAKQTLSLVTFTRRPITAVELQHALGVELGEDELDEDNLPQIESIVSICAGLVAVDKKSDIIRLVHYTTQEYFNRTREKWFPNAEADITKICVTYLSFKELGSGACHTREEFQQRL